MKTRPDASELSKMRSLPTLLPSVSMARDTKERDPLHETESGARVLVIIAAIFLLGGLTAVSAAADSVMASVHQRRMRSFAAGAKRGGDLQIAEPRRKRDERNPQISWLSGPLLRRLWR
jgi:hypothetical protein